MKNQTVSASAEKDTSKVVDFANMLLANHEAKMRQREIEGLYPTSARASKVENKVLQAETSVTVFASDDYPAAPSTSHQNEDDLTPNNVSHFRSLQLVEEMNESVENIHSARFNQAAT